MTIIYRRKDRSLKFSCEGTLGNPYIYPRVSELEIHQLAFENATIEDLTKNHKVSYQYDSKTGKENPKSGLIWGNT